jgi:NADPH:quinone reductase-like Zn-dependent oxidoreductase
MSNAMQQWEVSHFGNDNLRLNEVVIPGPGHREILVKVFAASLNYRDKLIIENGMGMALTMPFVSVSDFAGTVIEIYLVTRRSCQVILFLLSSANASSEVRGWS